MGTLGSVCWEKSGSLKLAWFFSATICANHYCLNKSVLILVGCWYDIVIGFYYRRSENSGKMLLNSTHRTIERHDFPHKVLWRNHSETSPACSWALKNMKTTANAAKKDYIYRMYTSVPQVIGLWIPLQCECAQMSAIMLQKSPWVDYHSAVNTVGRWRVKKWCRFTCQSDSACLMRFFGWVGRILV